MRILFLNVQERCLHLKTNKIIVHNLPGQSKQENRIINAKLASPRRDVYRHHIEFMQAAGSIPVNKLTLKTMHTGRKIFKFYML